MIGFVSCFTMNKFGGSDNNNNIIEPGHLAEILQNSVAGARVSVISSQWLFLLSARVNYKFLCYFTVYIEYVSRVSIILSLSKFCYFASIFIITDDQTLSYD